MSRLNKIDSDLLYAGANIDLSSAEHAYLGGEFTENPNDYIEVLIYDTNETFLESAVVDSGDYIYDEGEGIKLKTGTILRKLGYDRGRYVVKYNFLRKVAGSYENVLVDINNERYTEEFDPSNPTDRARIGNDLFIKEYKYLIHEISPTRKEVRLIPLNIKEEKYLRDFYDVQYTNKRVEADSETVSTGLKFKADGTGNELGESYQLEVEDSAAQFLQQMVGGTVMLPDVFVTGQYQLPMPQGYRSPQSSTEETVGTELRAQFYISNWDTALLQKGNPSNLEVPNGVIYKHFVGVEDNIATYDFTQAWAAEHNESWYVDVGVYWSENSPPGNLDAIKNLYDDKFNPPTYKPGGEIKIKSNSVKTSTDASISYTWRITGYDNDDPSDKDTWDPLVFGEDVEILPVSGRVQEIDGASVSELNSTEGSEIKLKLNSYDMHVGIELTIKEDGLESTIHLPACIETGRP